MTAEIMTALDLVLNPFVLMVILASCIYGLFIGAIPGLTATMSVALLVPITFFLDPVPAIAAIVSTTATAIFAGDIPGCLLRMPGTPASAAYVDESYALTQKGKSEIALSASLIGAVLGGILGVALLMVFAAQLARFAVRFS
ncbi:MAG TPA: C4-dicarboxylate ABC transporter permease, partial [Rhodobacteraceae bacterium]|nr:C4-dicarboxylate ABC transporter permease [Paracoccaceae bacterium]